MSYDECRRCNKIYTDTFYRWCKPCQTKDLKENFANWTSENEKIDNFIQEIQIKINKYDDIIFEWIPYNQFLGIEEIYKDDFFTVYSAMWKNGPLHWNKKYIRDPDEKAFINIIIYFILNRLKRILRCLLRYME